MPNWLNYKGCMTMVMVAAIFIDGADDEDDDDNDEVEHDVKDDPIVDSRSRLEQHNIKSSNNHRCHRNT